jgi:biopolymer transport protein ExbD
MARKVDDPSAAANATFNMTPMIDVVFQLIVVFLCSLKFRCLDEKMEAFLPPDGMTPQPSPRVPEPRLDVRLARPAASEAATLLVQGEPLGLASEGDPLWRRLEARIASVHARDPEVLGRIAADPEVEHGDVIRALDCFLGAGVSRVAFRGTPPPRR